MNLHLRPSMISLVFFIINIIIILHVPIPASGEDEQFLSCRAPFHCANLPNISYPFWGLNRQQYCGYPGFELDCGGDIAELKIMDRIHKVLSINNELQQITVAREDYWDDYCPSNPVNTTLNFSLLNYASETENLTLYYRCPDNFMTSTSAAQLPNQFACSSDEPNTNNYFLSWEINNYNNSLASTIRAYLGSCGNSVNIQVWQSTLRSVVDNPTSVNLTTVIREGFGLQWYANNSVCEECERSNGLCGYATRTGEFTCYCSDKPSSSSCKRSGNKKFSTSAGIGIGAAAVAFLFLGAFSLFFIRRKRKITALNKSKEMKTPSSSNCTTNTTTTTTTDSFQSAPSYPYSKSDLEKGSTYYGARVFTCAELEEATDNFSSSKELGDGGFGAVYLGILRDGRVVAVKRLYENSFKRAEQFKNEVEILSRLQHPNLLKLYGCTSGHSRELLLVYEYMPNKTVSHHLHSRKSNSLLLPWPVRLSIAIETADALAYLHASDVIHRDVKTNNILLDNSFRVKVADFGLSRLFPTDVTHVSTAPQGTPGYVDPEYFQCYKLTNKSDVYSFGVVLIELISGLEAVDTSRQKLDINLANMAVNKIQNQALHELVDPSLGFDKDNAVRNMVTSVAELAFRCLQQDREIRPTMKEVLEILLGIQKENLGAQKAEVVDICITDDVVLPNKNCPSLSLDGSRTDKGVSSSTATSSSF